MLSIYSATSETTGETYHLTIDQSRDTLLSEASHVLLKEGKYMLPEETSPQEAFARASIAFGSNQDHAQRLYDAVSRLWFMYASPVLSNAGNPRGLPASCNLTYMGDSREEIADTWKEMLFLATLGAGVGLNMSALRSVGTGNSRGTSTPGLIPFMKVIDSITMASKQGEVRRGATAVYLDIGHPEFQEFLVAREASDGGDINRKCQNIHHAVNIPDVFMEAVVEGKDWYFVDPHTKQIKGTTSARTLWMDILKMRMKTGEPYLHFIDASNRAMPQSLKDKGLRISQSNLCCVTGDQLVRWRSSKDGSDKLSSVGELYSRRNEDTEFYVRGSDGEWKMTVTPMQIMGESQAVTLYGEDFTHTVTYNHRIPTVFGGEPTLLMASEIITKLNKDEPVYVYVWEFGNFTPKRVTGFRGEGAQEVFCWEMPGDHLWVCNSVLTHNSEITLPTSPTRTATCFLSSLNLEMFEDWKDTPIVEDMVEMLDNVVEVYIRKAPPELWKAVASAKAERSIGLGMMGFHSYLQAKGIPFEGVIAAAANRRMFSHIHSKAIAHSKVLAKERGEAPDMETSMIIGTDEGEIQLRSSQFVETKRGKIRAFELEENDELLRVCH